MYYHIFMKFLSFWVSFSISSDPLVEQSDRKLHTHWYTKSAFFRYFDLLCFSIAHRFVSLLKWCAPFWIPSTVHFYTFSKCVSFCWQNGVCFLKWIFHIETKHVRVHISRDKEILKMHYCFITPFIIWWLSWKNAWPNFLSLA